MKKASKNSLRRQNDTRTGNKHGLDSSEDVGVILDGSKIENEYVTTVIPSYRTAVEEAAELAASMNRPQRSVS